MNREMEQVKIKRITTRDYKKGDKEFTFLNICVDLEVDGQVEETWLNGFENKTTREWKEGDVVTVNIEETDRINNNTGKPYLNYKLPDETDVLEQRINRQEEYVKRIYKMVKVLYLAYVEKERKGAPNPPSKSHNNAPAMNNPPQPPPREMDMTPSLQKNQQSKPDNVDYNHGLPDDEGIKEPFEDYDDFDDDLPF